MCFAFITASKGGDGSVHVQDVSAHNHSYGVEDLGSLSLPAAAWQALADKL